MNWLDNMVSYISKAILRHLHQGKSHGRSEKFKLNMTPENQ